MQPAHHDPEVRNKEHFQLIHWQRRDIRNHKAKSNKHLGGVGIATCLGKITRRHDSQF